MELTTLGIDLAKNVMQLHGMDSQGKTVLKKQLKRDKLLAYCAQLAPCLIGMEACGGAHHWARQLQAQGHRVKLLAPQYVKAYVKRDKSDAADAEAICEAVSRPRLPEVPVKSEEQQAILSLHRARQGFVKSRTGLANQMRGLLAEFGLVIPLGIRHIAQGVPALLKAHRARLPESFLQLMERLVAHWQEVDRQVGELERDILRWHQGNEASRRLAEMSGVGYLTASGMVAAAGDARNFRNGRQFAAWLGITPRQHSTGGKTVLLGISKRGDSYLRTLLIHGARSVLRGAQRKPQADSWLTQLLARRHPNVAAVALANKNARTIWALLAHGTKYERNYQGAAPQAA